MLNALLDAEDDALPGAGRYERADGWQDYRAGYHDRQLHTQAGEVALKVPKLRKQAFETAVIERYRRSEASVEECFDEDVFGRRLSPPGRGYHGSLVG